MSEARGRVRSVAIVSAVVPYPRDAGKKVVLAGLLEYWVARLGAEHVHYVLVGGESVALDGIPVTVHRIARPTTSEQLRSLTGRTVLTRKHSIQESMLYSRRVRRELGSVLERIGADLELYDTVRLGQYAEELPVRRGQRRVVYLDDLFSVRYARMLDVLRSRPDISLDPLGEFRANIPGPLARLVGLRPVQRRLLEAERRLVGRREQASARGFSTALLVNPDEAATLSTLTGVRTVREVPPVVDEPRRGRAYDGRPVFVLLGLLSLPHNHDAALCFLTEVMPRVVQAVPDVRVHIVGRGATPEILEAASRFPDHVRVEGFVPNLDALLGSACALLAPLRFGSGIKIKILEALARGLPVLATPVGAEGIRNGPEHGVLVEQELDRFPARMQAMTDLAYNARLSARGRAHFDGTYSREAAFRRYDAVFGDDVGSAEPARGDGAPGRVEESQRLAQG